MRLGKFKPTAGEKGQNNGKQTRAKQSCKIKFKAKGAVMEISFFTTLEPALAGAWIPSFAMVLIQFAYMFIYKEVGKRATDTSCMVHARRQAKCDHKLAAASSAAYFVGVRAA